MDKEWPCDRRACGYIHIEPGSGRFITPTTNQFIQPDVMFCQFCGAKRPEPKKKKMVAPALIYWRGGRMTLTEELYSKSPGVVPIDVNPTAIEKVIWPYGPLVEVGE